MSTSSIAVVGRQHSKRQLDADTANPSVPSSEWRYRVLDASAARDRHSGRMVIYALAAWFVASVLILAWGLTELVLAR